MERMEWCVPEEVVLYLWYCWCSWRSRSCMRVSADDETHQGTPPRGRNVTLTLESGPKGASYHERRLRCSVQLPPAGRSSAPSLPCTRSQEDISNLTQTCVRH
ncbi:hypothetical protein CBL_14316 [Carabus blaptoides fortunei]